MASECGWVRCIGAVSNGSPSTSQRLVRSLPQADELARIGFQEYGIS